MDRFEYLCEAFSKPIEQASAVTMQTMMAELNKMGADGWELVQQSARAMGDQEWVWRTWKRKVQS